MDIARAPSAESPVSPLAATATTDEHTRRYVSSKQAGGSNNEKGERLFGGNYSPLSRMASMPEHCIESTLESDIQVEGVPPVGGKSADNAAADGSMC